jgi:hypothetical protein
MAIATSAVEIRSYALMPGTRDAFHRLMSGEAVPMLRRWQVDVVAHGPSPHDDDSYYLIRSYRDLAERGQPGRVLRQRRMARRSARSHPRADRHVHVDRAPAR